MIRWGILSTGTIARNFARTARQMGDVTLHAVASRSQESADAFGDAYGIERRYASYERWRRTRRSTSSMSPRRTAATLRI